MYTHPPTDPTATEETHTNSNSAPHPHTFAGGRPPPAHQRGPLRPQPRLLRQPRHQRQGRHRRGGGDGTYVVRGMWVGEGGTESLGLACFLPRSISIPALMAPPPSTTNEPLSSTHHNNATTTLGSGPVHRRGVHLEVRESPRQRPWRLGDGAGG